MVLNLSADVFPDLQQFLQLRRELWSSPGRAAVMVGAGFSRNAIRLPGKTSSFPLWTELARSMFDELYPYVVGLNTKEELDRQFARDSNYLRLASKFEANFGVPRVDELIRTSTPDSDFIPGNLHVSLMRLPWVDVFTTNYDTLLERTKVHNRVYSLVNGANRLTTARAPRIIKLHGCFSTNAKLIISEEDFRTYPRQFAPFVNTVQQSLLENSFVLLGFSGEDPNFLAWTGWIRDQIGGQHAPIYLVGNLGLTDGERRFLANRGVTPIDLKRAFATSDDPHRESISWTLECLHSSKPPNPMEWPWVSGA